MYPFGLNSYQRRYWLEFSKDSDTDLVSDENGRRRIEERIQSWLKGERPVLILPPGVTLHHTDHPSAPPEHFDCGVLSADHTVRR